MEVMGAHILAFPYPAPGHMIPFLDLIHQLASHGGLHITILVTTKNQHLIQPLLSTHPSIIKPLLFPFPSYPFLPPGVEYLKDVRGTSGARSIWMDMTCALLELRHGIIHWFKKHDLPPVAILSDMFLGWTQGLASELGIFRYVFSPSGVFAYAILHSLWLDMPRSNQEDEVISFPNMPNCPKYPWWQISPTYRRCVENEGAPESGIVRDGFFGNLRSDGLVINSFDELERSSVEYLKKVMGYERVWPIGPLLPLGQDKNGPVYRGGDFSKISSWLDSCDEGSVLYVCFGSQHVLTRRQMQVLASGLEKSGVKFIWVVKEGQVEGQDGTTLPIGYEESVEGRGLIVKEWAPQLSILRHPGVGAFLTHCGWNSTLEGIVAGVPMLAWPMAADQFADATLLVDDLKVAVRIGESEKTVPNPDQFADMVAKIMSPGNAERSRAMELRKAALEAISEGGSSYQNLDDFVLQLSNQPKA